MKIITWVDFVLYVVALEVDSMNVLLCEFTNVCVLAYYMIVLLGA